MRALVRQAKLPVKWMKLIQWWLVHRVPIDVLITPEIEAAACAPVYDSSGGLGGSKEAVSKPAPESEPETASSNGLAASGRHPDGTAQLYAVAYRGKAALERVARSLRGRL